MGIKRSEDGKCVVCGAWLPPGRFLYCSEHCAAIHAKFGWRSHWKEKEEGERKRTEMRVRVLDSRRRCKGCAWKSPGNNFCIMPSCFKMKGIGYEESDTDLAAMVQDIADMQEAERGAGGV